MTAAAIEGAGRPQAKWRGGLIWGLAALLCGAAGANLIACMFLDGADHALIYLFNAALSFYLFLECRRMIVRGDDFSLISPPLVASLLFFFLAFVLPVSASLIDPSIIYRINAWTSSGSTALAAALAFALLSAFCMWRGYDLGRSAAAGLRSMLLRANVFRKSFRPNLPPLILLQIVYLALVAFAITRGVFGISSSVESHERSAGFLEFINIGIASGDLSLLLLLTHVFNCNARRERALGLSIICVVLVVIHLGVGVLSGFKNQMVMPFLILAFASFLATGKIKLHYLVMIVIALIVSYQVIQPYRAYLNRSREYGGSSVGNLTDAVLNSHNDYANLVGDGTPLSNEIATRLDLTVMTGLGMEAAQDGIVDSSLISDMRKSVYLAPILAFTPRALWTNKPIYGTGIWFDQIVLNNPSDVGTSVGMGPIAYLYFVGGAFAVMIGFVCIGFFQAILFDGIARAGAGGIVVFLSVATQLYELPGDIGPVVTGMVRVLPIAFLVQYFLLKPDVVASEYAGRR